MLEQQLVNGLMLGSVYALVAVAFTLAIGVLNFLNFSIPGLFMVGGMLTWYLLRAQVPWPVAAVLAVASGGLLAILVERFTYRLMSRSAHFVPLVTSMAFLILFENLALIIWGSDVQRLPLPFESVSFRLGPTVVALPQLVGLGCAIAAVAFLDALLKRTRIGRGLRTIAEDPETAALLGVPVERVVPVVFIVGGLFTALGGFLFAVNYQQASPFMGEEVALKGISAMVVGGMGNIWGAILGGLLIGVVETFSIHWFGARAVDIGVYGLLLAILFVRPTGILGGTMRQQRI
ncbi:MAG: branched-chain amino acid ABC transporter permease [Betaproteobacteria bacterium]